MLVPAAVLEEFAARTEDLSTRSRWLEALGFEIRGDEQRSSAIDAWDLGAGETAALALGVVLPNSIVVLDDRQGRRCAESLGIKTLGTLGLLVRAQRIGRIGSARRLIEQLQDHGMFVSDELLQRVFELLDNA